MPVIASDKGVLTAYGLHCGYVQSFTFNGYRVELFHDGCYHVRVFNESLPCDRWRLVWRSFYKLTTARHTFCQYLRDAKAGRTIESFID